MNTEETTANTNNNLDTYPPVATEESSENHSLHDPADYTIWGQGSQGEPVLIMTVTHTSA